MHDSDIVDLYLNRDESAILYTAEQYGNQLRHLSFNIVGDIETAKECENDTYMQAWSSIPPHEPRTYLFAFLARIIRHISLDHCRRQSRTKRNGRLVELTQEMEQCLPSSIDIENQINAQHLSSAISKFLRSQPETHRNVFIRRYWYLDSITDISKRFLFTESKTKSMLMRTRNQLRKYLEKEGFLL